MSRKEEKKKKNITEIENDYKTEEKTIAYLENTNKRSFLIEKGINNLKENYKLTEHEYLYDFKEDEKLQVKFKNSINEHLDWIIAYSTNEFADNSDLKDYQNNDILSYETYCFFYNYLINFFIKDVEPNRLKENLKCFFIHIKNEYCIRKENYCQDEE